MDLQQAADEAMEYLDSVGVAAEYEIRMRDYNIDQLSVFTDDCIIGISSKAVKLNHQEFMEQIKQQYPQKSPN
ncbi:hypothetical protein [Pseudoalteromonas phage XCL1123]|nr:hypothetical protein [Pseudoalteromonas phage XCL1123]